MFLDIAIKDAIKDVTNSELNYFKNITSAISYLSPLCSDLVNTESIRINRHPFGLLELLKNCQKVSF